MSELKKAKPANTSKSFRTVQSGAYAVRDYAHEAEKLWRLGEEEEAAKIVLQIVQDCDTLLGQAISLRDEVCNG